MNGLMQRRPIENLDQPHGFLLAVADRTVVLSLILGTLALATFLLLDYQRFIAHRQTLIDQELQRLDSLSLVLTNSMSLAVNRVHVVRESYAVQEYLWRPSPVTLERLRRDLSNLVQHSQLYSGISVFSLQGQPQIQIRNRSGELRSDTRPAPPSDRLQAFVQQMSVLPPNSIRLADIDTAEGALFRIGAVVHPAGGSNGAVIVFDYLAHHFLEPLRLARIRSFGPTTLVTAAGMALPGERGATAESAALSNSYHFASRYPEAWRQIRADDSGIAWSGSDLFIFVSLHPPGTLPTGANGDDTDNLQRWKLVSHLLQAQHHYEPATMLYAPPPALAGAAVGVVFFSGLLSWLWVMNQRKSIALQISEERLNLALRGANEGLWDCDRVKHQVYLSPHWKAMLGYRDDELSNSKSTWAHLLHPEDRPHVLAELRKTLDGSDTRYVDRYRLQHKSGHYIWGESRGEIHRDERGRAIRIVGTLLDITQAVVAEGGLRQAAAVFESTTEAIVIFNDQGRITAVNKAFEQITGYNAAEVLGRDRDLLWSEHQNEEFFRQLDQSLAAHGSWRGEILARRRSGEDFPGWLNVSVVADPNGRIRNYVAVIADITAIKASEERLQHQAHHDALTGLPNRLLLTARLEQAIERAQRHEQRVALMFLDLDRFKLINDTLGHACGDQLLKVIAERLLDCVRNEDTVARLGGDEFVVLLEELRSPADASGPAEKIIDTVGVPVPLRGHLITPSTSIGISVYPDDAATPDDLTKMADAAMYRAKQEGRHNFQFYTPELTEQATRRFTLEAELRSALENEQLVLHYQPQYTLDDPAVVGLEALARWNHPVQGLVMPDRFIEVAEESGLIEPLGEWVLQTVVQDWARWRNAGIPGLRLAVNLTTRQLGSRRFMWRVREIAGQAARDGTLELDLEIKETALQAAIDSAETLHELRTLGIRLTIDDFGTGHSSLKLLQRLPVDTLKIDRCFVSDLATNRHSRAITEAIITLAHSLRLRVLAQGIETEEQLRILRELGCDQGQGFLFEPPMQAHQLPERMKHFASHSRNPHL